MALCGASQTKGEEDTLDGAAGSGDAWYGCQDVKLCVCTCARNPTCFSFHFPPLIIYKAIKGTRLLLDLGMSARPPTAEMCLILRAIMMPLPVSSPGFLNSCSSH